MTDIDLDAIRARHRDTSGPMLWRASDRHLAALETSVADVPALLGRLAEVEAERDRERNDRIARDEWARDVAVFHGMTREGGDDLFAVIAKHIKRQAAENARLRQERDEMFQAGEKLIDDMREVYNDRDAMRPVVEAAEAWRDIPLRFGSTDAEALRQDIRTDRVLRGAVDAYRAGQNRPETALSATGSQDLHPDGPGSTSDTPEAHRPAEAFEADEAALDATYARLVAHDRCGRCGGKLPLWECELLERAARIGGAT